MVQTLADTEPDESTGSFTQFDNSQTIEGIPVDPDNLVCAVCDKRYNQFTWLEKHIKDKHPAGSGTSDMGTPQPSFQSASDVFSYVSQVASLGDPDSPSMLSSGSTEVEDEDQGMDFELSIEQSKALVNTFNVFIDNIMSLFTKLDIVYYSNMPKSSVTAMGRAISSYMKNTNMRISPGTFLMINLGLVYGSMTAKLPGHIKELREKESEQESAT